MDGVISFEYESSDCFEFVEVDPTGRYGRYNEILGKGASKIVYKAFDEYEGIEVAWNQVKLSNFLQSPEELERLYREIHLLKTLKHKNIMKYYTSWVDTENRNINFVTEMFTSGTLRQYRMKHRRVNIRAVKHWCRQILNGLVYLHNHDPPIIHRDLKCDNIFINGNQGEVKIGDLGLAAILRKPHIARCVGTPEFMAPEVYAEEYNELVDIYAFGMCILELVTFDYPYSECTHPAQIYKKVMSGKRPDALFEVVDPEVRQFVEKCLASVSQRLSAVELLDDPFLQVDGYVSDLRPCDIDSVDLLQQPPLELHRADNSLENGYANYLGHEENNYFEIEADEIDLFASQYDDNLENVDISIKGTMREDDGIFLRLRIADKEGHVRNIYFPFDVENDSAISVATEMVAELDITEQDVTKISDMIDGEISSLVPDWKREESLRDVKTRCCENCSSSGSLVDYVTTEKSSAKNLTVLQCSEHGCAVNGRFEEITYRLDGSEQCVSDNIHYNRLSSRNSSENHSGDEHEVLDRSMARDEKENELIDTEKKSSAMRVATEEYENEIRRELRWLKAKYQLQLRELKDQQLGVDSKSHIPKSDSIASISRDGTLHFTTYSPYDAAKKFANMKISKYEASYSSCSPEHIVTAKSFYSGSLLPHSLHRATSLPVDATDY